nr:MAG TPA: hypothetical protein [Caudoviricetes sp.]
MVMAIRLLLRRSLLVHQDALKNQWKKKAIRQ